MSERKIFWGVEVELHKFRHLTYSILFASKYVVASRFLTTRQSGKIKSLFYLFITIFIPHFQEKRPQRSLFYGDEEQEEEEEGVVVEEGEQGDLAMAVLALQKEPS